MPTYEYECQKCGKHFDLFQRITEEPIKKCPTCKGKVKRLLGTGAGIIFKGSGFYQTDYRSESYKKGAKADTAAGGDAKPSSESKSTSDSKGTTDSKSAAPKKKAD
jgi:putative FmdB family regulatory protein